MRAARLSTSSTVARLLVAGRYREFPERLLWPRRSCHVHALNAPLFTLHGRVRVGDSYSEYVSLAPLLKRLVPQSIDTKPLENRLHATVFCRNPVPVITLIVTTVLCVIYRIRD